MVRGGGAQTRVTLRAVHQLVPVMSRGDAIGSAVIRFQAMLRSLGHPSEVFAGLIDRRAGRGIAHADGLQQSLRPGDAVMYHLSIGSELARMFESLETARLVYFHNVTPPSTAVAWSPVLAHALRWGVADLAALAPAALLCMAPSRYSCAELWRAGALKVADVPVPVDVRRLRPRPAEARHEPTLLFVGRFAPHKRQDVLIRVVAALRATRIPTARLVLAGGPAVPAYLDALLALAEQLDVADAVDIIDTPLSDRRLGDLYASASLFVCASDHEGFCVPLIEAMAFSLPVLAHDAAAVAETVGDAGVVVGHQDPALWAELAWQLITDAELRRAKIASGRHRVAAFADTMVIARLEAALAQLT